MGGGGGEEPGVAAAWWLPVRVARTLGAAVAFGAAVAALVAATGAAPRPGRAELRGGGLGPAQGVKHDLHLLAQSKKRALSHAIAATRDSMQAFDAQFDAAFNEGWREQGRPRRQRRADTQSAQPRAAEPPRRPEQHTDALAVVRRTSGGSTSPGGATAAQLQSTMARAQDLVARVQSLAATQQSSTMCRKRDMIVSLLDRLLERLKRESGILNITDTAAYQKMKLENAVWLEVESIYRLSLEKAHDDDTEEDFAQDQLEVKNRIETLTQKDLEQTIREYPEKKAVVDGERQVVIELIDMVEDIDTDNLRDAHRREQLSTALGRSSSMLAQVTRREERALPQRERPQVLSAVSFPVSCHSPGLS